MDLSENLRSTLESTLALALNLEQVGSMLIPRKIGLKGRRRINLINKEIKDLSHLSSSKPKARRKNSQESRIFESETHTHKEIILDSPAYSVKQKLSYSLKEVNQRVKSSRAGRRSIGEYILDSSPPASKNLTNLQTSVNNFTTTSRIKHHELAVEKPRPYVSLVNGKIEDPITLPTFAEFLERSGSKNVIRKGTDELNYRIEKATEKIDKLNELLDQKLNSVKKQGEKKVRRGSLLLESKSMRKNNHESKLSKKDEIKSLMNQYYKMPCYYSTPRSAKEKRLATPNKQGISTVDAEESLGETLRNFYKSKAVENKKLEDILEKISNERPYCIKKKFELIQKDKEKFKNKLYSIEKFNDFRGQVEARKREKQYKNYEQGLFYLEILEEYKRKKYDPSECELLILELWKRTVESGLVIIHSDLSEYISLLTLEESRAKSTQELIEKLSSIC